MERDHITSKRPRVFLGIPLIPFFSNEIKTYLKPIQPRTSSLRWSTFDSLHVTLHFFGEVEESRLPDIHRMANKVCQRLPPLELKLSGLGYFPDKKKPRVIWIGVQGKDQLMELQRNLVSRLDEIGFESESRPYRPHATVARVKKIGQFMTQEMRLFTEFDATEVKRIPHIALFERMTSRDGNYYQIRERYELGQK